MRCTECGEEIPDGARYGAGRGRVLCADCLRFEMQEMSDSEQTTLLCAALGLDCDTASYGGEYSLIGDLMAHSEREHRYDDA